MTSHKDFEGRTALVTGAASGIGAACAKLLDQQGAAKLFLVDVDEAGMRALDLSCEVEFVIGSVADEALWAELEPKLEGLDHAVANAGIASSGTIAELTLSDWRRIMDVNLDGAFMTLSTAMRVMLSGGKGGSAVITSSTTGVKAVPGIGPYGVSKAAVAHMARIAALEGASAGIRVNAIAPGGVDTAIWDSSEAFREAEAKIGREAAIKGMATSTPSGRFATSEEMAGTILYLLSDAAANVTGHVMVSDGGFTL